MALSAADALRSDPEALARVQYRQSRLIALWDIAAAKDQAKANGNQSSRQSEGWQGMWDRQIAEHRYSWRL